MLTNDYWLPKCGYTSGNRTSCCFVLWFVTFPMGHIRFGEYIGNILLGVVRQIQFCQYPMTIRFFLGGSFWGVHLLEFIYSSFRYIKGEWTNINGFGKAPASGEHLLLMKMTRAPLNLIIQSTISVAHHIPAWLLFETYSCHLRKPDLLRFILFETNCSKFNPVVTCFLGEMMFFLLTHIYILRDLPFSWIALTQKTGTAQELHWNLSKNKYQLINHNIYPYCILFSMQQLSGRGLINQQVELIHNVILNHHKVELLARQSTDFSFFLVKIPGNNCCLVVWIIFHFP